MSRLPSSNLSSPGTCGFERREREIKERERYMKEAERQERGGKKRAGRKDKGKMEREEIFTDGGEGG